MPDALAVGVPYELFWHLSPKKIHVFHEAYKTKLKWQDQQMWMMGQYILSAVQTATDRCLNGRKSRSQYLKKPIMESAETERKELTEEELQKQREAFVTKLLIMKSNFDMNKKKLEEEGQ